MQKNKNTPAFIAERHSSQANFALFNGIGNRKDNVDNSNHNTNRNRNQFTYFIDADKLSSPEALCLVQLLSVLDIGAAVFPPKTVTKIAAGELILHQEEEMIMMTTTTTMHTLKY